MVGKVKVWLYTDMLRCGVAIKKSLRMSDNEFNVIYILCISCNSCFNIRILSLTNMEHDSK